MAGDAAVAMGENTPEVRTSGLAIASLVLSIMTVVLGPLGCIPGIICGHLARSETWKNPSLGGEEVARAGLIVGYYFLVLGMIGLFLFTLALASHAPVTYPPQP